MRAYKPYTAYKDSGIDWIKKIPESWNILPICYVAKPVSISNNSDKELLSVFLDLGVVRFQDVEKKRTNVTSLDLSKYQLVEEGDFVLNNQQAWRGSVGVSFYEGIVSPAYIVTKLTKDLNSTFANYLFRDKCMVAHYLVNSKGVGTIQRNLYWPHLKRALTIIPPREEQTAIANFLDRKTAEIKQFIALKEKTIELLKERKIAIINQAVTKGLNPSVKMKDSGIEWLGDIPAHWEVKKLKYLLKSKLKYGANESAELDNRDYPRYIRITDFGNDGKLKNDTFKSLNPKVAKDFLLEEGDILFARSGGTVGKTFLFSKYQGEACFAGYLIKASVSDEISPDFLYLYTKSGAYEKWKDSIFNQATIQNIGADKYSILPVTVPSVDEQRDILIKIALRTKVLDTSISQAEKEIELIKEYRESLISEAVTGKIDVREL